MAAQHFQVVTVDTSLVQASLTPVNSDWWENYIKGRSDPVNTPTPLVINFNSNTGTYVVV